MDRMGFSLSVDSLLIAITAWVYVRVLCQDGMILGWWSAFIEKRLPMYLAKPIVSCEYCVAGQLSLWYYVGFNFWNYDLITNIFFVSLTIFIIEIINGIKKIRL